MTSSSLLVSAESIHSKHRSAFDPHSYLIASQTTSRGGDPHNNMLFIVSSAVVVIAAAATTAVRKIRQEYVFVDCWAWFECIIHRRLWFPCPSTWRSAAVHVPGAQYYDHPTPQTGLWTNSLLNAGLKTTTTRGPTRSQSRIHNILHIGAREKSHSWPPP